MDSGTAPPTRTEAPEPGKAEDPREVMLRELTRAAEGAGQIAEGAERARHEVASILRDPVGRRALDHLLINAETVQEHPELLKSFAAYITPDGRRARIDLAQAERVFSGRRDGPGRRPCAAGSPSTSATWTGRRSGPRSPARTPKSADIRALTRSDQFQSWFVVPIGVFLVLLVALRDPLACLNLVATMLLTYAFALGTTHLVFVTILGAEGIDWKVPYFLFVLLVAVGVDYNVFLMDRVRQESERMGLRSGIIRAVGADRRPDLLGRGDHRVQLRLVPGQPARLAPAARFRAGGGDHRRRPARPPAARPLRPLAAAPPPRGRQGGRARPAEPQSLAHRGGRLSTDRAFDLGS